MAEFRNLFVFIPDSLRYDVFVEQLDQSAIPTLAPSLHTPTSFASFFTAREPRNHNVRSFLEELDPSFPTAFDYFSDTAFYDGEGSSIIKYIFHSERRELTEMEEPFIWIERGLDTHVPYGEVGHDQQVEGSGREYIEKCRSGEINVREAYRNGVQQMWRHFQRHVTELEDRGILDETLVVITSDHGELLGERFLGRRRFAHNYPPLQGLVEVPTVFYNATVDAPCMRLVDVLPTAFSIMGKPVFGDGVDVRRTPVREGENVMEDVKASLHTTWQFTGEDGWRPTWGSRVRRLGNVFLGDMKQVVYQDMYKPLANAAEERFAADEEQLSELKEVDL